MISANLRCYRATPEVKTTSPPGAKKYMDSNRKKTPFSRFYDPAGLHGGCNSNPFKPWRASSQPQGDVDVDAHSPVETDIFII